MQTRTHRPVSILPTISAFDSHGRAYKFARPTGHRRAKISGNWLTIFLVRARAERPLGAPDEKYPGN
eukprot:6229260-Pyramimonas_sp.AAC.1